MEQDNAEIVVAGHICLDIIPDLGKDIMELDSLLVPGKLNIVGPAVISTGGAVSNTGLALYRLGVPTKLVGKVGNDLFGQAIINKLRSFHKSLLEGMIIEEDESSSYSIIINLPGVDRIFLHYPGTNDSFISDDVEIEKLKGAEIFHFGYPPAMKCMYINKGEELKKLMEKVKDTGLITSLDMSYPDPDSDSGKVNWKEILMRVLPYVDIFLPSLEEIIFMLKLPNFKKIVNSKEEISNFVDSKLLSKIGEQLINMGVAITVLKLGDHGLYVRTTNDINRLASIDESILKDINGWLNRELLSPCFKVNVVGTTGAGDCTIAGFLAGFIKGLSIEDVMRIAMAVGAFNVESPDATSSIPDWSTLLRRIKSDWETHDVSFLLENWHWNEEKNIWVSPNDKKISRYLNETFKD